VFCTYSVKSCDVSLPVHGVTSSDVIRAEPLGVDRRAGPPECRLKGEALERRSKGEAPQRRSKGEAPKRRSKGEALEHRSKGEAPERRSKGEAPERRSKGEAPERRPNSFLRRSPRAWVE
jgi:hypothetical protein